MSRRRGRERAARQAIAVGRSVHLSRALHGWSTRTAADRAGVARSTWERIEAGSEAVTLRILVAAADAVGLDLVCQTYPGREPSLRDSGQLTIAQELAILRNPSWAVGLEEPAGEHGEAVDMVLRGASEIIAIEIERLLLDWQAQFRRATLKRDWLAARHARPVRLVMLVADTRRNRHALTPYLPTIRTVLPGGSRQVYRALRSGTPLGADALCWFRSNRSLAQRSA